MLCTIPAECPAAGRSLRDLDVRATTGAEVLAVLRGREVLTAPSLDARLQAGDSVVLLGNPDQVGAAVEALIGSAG
jgi:K+/H+ antiporter YhaU regulatory subunit KhtT